jgi:hypothetical protein
MILTWSSPKIRFFGFYLKILTGGTYSESICMDFAAADDRTFCMTRFAVSGFLFLMAAHMSL